MSKFLKKIKDSLINIFHRNNKILEENNTKSTFEEFLLKQYGNCKERKKFNIKILFITDTHNCLAYDTETLQQIKNATDYDYCILLGDHSAMDLDVITKIIPKDKLCGVLGNHDSWEKYKEYSIKNIDGQVVEIKGVRIAGSSGSFKYKNSEEYALYTHEESVEIANKMGNADILVTHDKPFIKKEFGDAHDGLKGITQYIYEKHIPLHIHGHLHEESEAILKSGTRSIGIYKAKLIEF